MQSTSAILTSILLIVIGTFSLHAHAADGAIKVTSTAQIETVEIDKQGNKKVKLAPVVKAVPGTEVVFTNTFENGSKDPANNIVINNAIPRDSEYTAGSAFGKNCEILFSADGGNRFGHAEDLKINVDGKERTALPKEYTHIRWTYQGQLDPGKKGEVGFRAVIK
jgi:uncharacterized repeat protein (TIGR01451 family)